MNSMPNVHAEIINYVPENYKIYPYEKTYHGIEMMQKKKEGYEEFLLREGLVSGPMQNIVSGNEYDYYVVGSDQVWNLGFRENVNNEYLLPNLDAGAKRISYAASIGKTIQSGDMALFKEHLGKFGAISVREESSAQELAQIGIKNVSTVLDPTLLLEADDYDSLIKEPDNRPEDFLFFFSYPIGDEIRKYVPFVNMLARKNSLRTVHSLVNAPKDLFSNDAGCMMYEGIGEFLWYVKNAKAVVTMSYHGAILGWLFDRPTYIIQRDTGWGRIKQLSDILDLKDQIIGKDWSMRHWNINDYYKRKGNLQMWRDKSRIYLNNALER